MLDLHELFICLFFFFVLKFVPFDPSKKKKKKKVLIQDPAEEAEKLAEKLAEKTENLTGLIWLIGSWGYWYIGIFHDW